MTKCDFCDVNLNEQKWEEEHPVISVFTDQQHNYFILVYDEYKDHLIGRYYINYCPRCGRNLYKEETNK